MVWSLAGFLGPLLTNLGRIRNCRAQDARSEVGRLQREADSLRALYELAEAF